MVIFVFIFTTLISSVATVDLTIEYGAKGADVVRATLQRIYDVDIFEDDLNFLRNIAWVETRFGEDQDEESI